MLDNENCLISNGIEDCSYTCRKPHRRVSLKTTKSNGIRRDLLGLRRVNLNWNIHRTWTAQTLKILNNGPGKYKIKYIFASNQVGLRNGLGMKLCITLKNIVYVTWMFYVNVEYLPIHTIWAISYWYSGTGKKSAIGAASPAYFCLEIDKRKW